MGHRTSARYIQVTSASVAPREDDVVDIPSPRSETPTPLGSLEPWEAGEAEGSSALVAALEEALEQL